MLEHQYSAAGMIKETGRTLFNWLEMKLTWWPTLRSSLVGFVVGVLPGAGATIAGNGRGSADMAAQSPREMISSRSGPTDSIETGYPTRLSTRVT
jgi:TctA family transporter